ncbi:MAG: hypothetical protein LBV75_05250 [Paludibacter sp.]|nr:hypothetical protein [Paludibacter sp.]
MQHSVGMYRSVEKYAAPLSCIPTECYQWQRMHSYRMLEICVVRYFYRATIPTGLKTVMRQW